MSIETTSEAPNNVTVVDLSQPKAETPTPEVKTDLAPTPSLEVKPQEDPKFSARFAALSRKERELINKEKSFKESQQKLAQYETAMKEARTNPVALLQAAGYKDLEEYLQTVVAETPKEDITTQKLTQIEQKILKYEQEAKEHQERVAQNKKTQELNQIHQDITAFINQNAEQYELVKEYNAIDDVWSLIEKVYVDTKGKVHLTMEQAAQEVEAYLTQEATKERDRLARIKKFQVKKIEEQTSPPTDNSWNQQSTVEEWKVAPTLTNSNTTLPQPSQRALTAEERRARAVAKLRWTDE